MAPGCRYCRMSDDNLFHTWCSGNCEFNKIEGTCTEIKGIHNITLDLRVLNHQYNECITKRYFYQTLDDYVKVYHSNCLSGRGFGTLAEAKYACSNDNHCVGILDEGCKEDFEYYICLDFYSEDKELSSCVYKKAEAKGTSY